MSDYLVIVLPIIVAILYFTTGMSWLYKKDYAEAMLWVCYSLSNIALVWIAINKINSM